MDRKKIIHWHDPALSKRDAVSISGLNYLKSIKEGQRKPPPAAQLVGYRITDVGEGYAAFEMDPQEYHYNPFATVHGGILSTLLDTAMTASVLSTLSKGFTCSTVEIKVNFIKAVTEKTGLISCEARPVYLGKRLATVEGRVRDKEGAILAHGVSTCAIIEVKRA